MKTKMGSESNSERGTGKLNKTSCVLSAGSKGFVVSEANKHPDISVGCWRLATIIAPGEGRGESEINSEVKCEGNALNRITFS